MRTEYSISTPGGFSAVVRLALTGPQEWHICSVYTPPTQRRRGLAAQLMQQVIDEADYEDVLLTLEVSATGSMNRHQLQEWYRRLGFVEQWDRTYLRRPECRAQPIAY